MSAHALELPALPYEEWAPTKKTLQMCAQMLGKTRLALSPPQPEWLHTALYLDGHGFTTGPVPHARGLLTAGIDVYASEMWVRASDGGSALVPIGEGRCVANIWEDLRAALEGLGVRPDVWEKPQEIPDTTPFPDNRHDCTIVPEHAQRFFRLLAALDGVYEEFRSPFFGRSGVQFWWGAFDYAVWLFSGKKAAAPDDRGYIMRYDLDAEHLNAGFWPGDDSAPEPAFYAYITPRPDGCETARVEPAHAGWVEAMGEWMLPYESVRTCDDPRQALLDFFRSVYVVAVTNGGWDAESYRYTLPPAARRR